MCVICCFSLAAFNICSLCLIFVNLINMCVGVFRLGFILFGTLWVSWTWVIISFPILGKFSLPYVHSTTGPLRDVHGVLQRREEGGRRQRWPEEEKGEMKRKETDRQ